MQLSITECKQPSLWVATTTNWEETTINSVATANNSVANVNCLVATTNNWVETANNWVETVYIWANIIHETDVTANHWEKKPANCQQIKRVQAVFNYRKRYITL